MCPIYLVLAAPLAKIVRMPLGMWYTHWAIDWELRVATALADVALSVDRRSYPIDRPKVLGIGHGIDVAQFAAREAAPPGNGTLRLLALGRTSPSKGFATLVRACGRARREGLDLQVAIHGASTTDEERRHRVELEQVIAAEGLTGVVSVGQAVPRPQVPELVRGRRRRRQHDVVAARGRGAGQGRLRGGRVRRPGPRLQPLLRPVPRRSSDRSALRQRRRRRPRSHPARVRRRATRARGRRQAASYGGGSKPATPSTAGRTQSSRRFSACATESCGSFAAM